jgi:hypothetical protein
MWGSLMFTTRVQAEQDQKQSTRPELHQVALHINIYQILRSHAHRKDWKQAQLHLVLVSSINEGLYQNVQHC